MPDESEQKEQPYLTPPALWSEFKPLARNMRRVPTPAEAALWERLRSRQIANLKFRRQHSIDRYIVDFYCPEAHLVIEVDGPIHDQTEVDDAVRSEVLENLGLRVLRFKNDEVLTHIDEVISRIREAIL